MGLCTAAKRYLPHLLITSSFLCMAAFIVLLQSVISAGVSSSVLVFYEHLIATLLLSSFAFFLEKNKRPPFTFKILCWAFLLGFLQITSGQILLTSSLRYIQATSQTIILNTITALTFILAVVFRQETFEFCTVKGQAKLWGTILSTTGTTVMVVWTGPEIKLFSILTTTVSLPLISGNQIIGYLMAVGSLVGFAAANLLVARVTKTYHADMSLTAMMSFCGTFQSAIVAALMERSASAWKISWVGSLELPAILYGGIIVTGLNYYLQTWCIHKKGPVFVSAFSPLLIVFSFLLETLFLRKAIHLGSIAGAILVVMGLYFLLWAKAYESEEENMGKRSIDSPLNKPLIEQEF